MSHVQGTPSVVLLVHVSKCCVGRMCLSKMPHSYSKSLKQGDSH